MQDFEHRPYIGLERLGEEAREALLASPQLPGHIVEPWATLTDELLDVVAERLDSVDADELRLHGDLHPGNILYGSDGTPQLLDFDDAGTGPAIQDLWMCLSGERSYAQARLGDLLDGYHEFRDLDLHELELIEPLRTLRIIHHAGWLASRWEEPAFQRGFPHFAEGRFWDEHMHALREQQAALDEPPLVY